MKKSVLTFLLVLFALPVLAQKTGFGGVVAEKKSGTPVEYATVLVEATGQWAVTDAQGRFTIQAVSAPKSTVSIASLGYVTLKQVLDFGQLKEPVSFLLEEDNLALNGAVVTAKENEASATTSRTIDKTALEHVQLMNVSGIASLLPGGVTLDNNLVTSREFSIRTGTSAEEGNPSFGTAVEVDGVRLSNNASYADFRQYGAKGVSTNSIASANVESVEVLTGVPSVEYGDMTSGVVKINTKKGKTPWILTLSTSPKTKQASLSKGFGLGKTRRGASAGILNAGAEYTRSVSDPMSPYTSYDRKQLSITYSNMLGNVRPLRFSAGVTGNLGGLDNQADPDKMVGTFVTARDNSIRMNLNVNWLLSLPWITNLEFNASGSFSDKSSRENKLYTRVVSDVALHTQKKGYFLSAPYTPKGANDVVLIPPGTGYNVLAVDDRPVTAKVSLKANWATHLGKAGNKVKLGADWNFDHNLGGGLYSEDLATAPTYREYRYCDNPSMHNLGLFLEDRLTLPLGKGNLSLVAGIRSDHTSIKGSAYGLTSSFSPRFNARYSIPGLAFRASWGVAVKLPSFSVLYPAPTYQDVEIFTSTASDDNTVYRGYYVLPRTLDYNAHLRWQRNQQAEIGVEALLAGIRISLAAYYNRTLNSYRLDDTYEPFHYKYTGTGSVQGLVIPSQNRLYSIDSATGIVTVSDKTGVLPSQTIAAEERSQLVARTYANNAHYPITRYGVEWVVDFPRIRAIGTSIRIDGNYYHYKTLDTDMAAYSPVSTMGSNGLPFRYTGYYIGGNSVANGSISRTLNNNITITTHIPKVRLILSVKLESSLLRHSRSLSDFADGSERARVLADRGKLLEFTPGASIYQGNSFAVVFPEYYESLDHPGVQVPYLEKLLWARENDPKLYNDLARLALTSNYLYTFNEDYLSPYFSANFSVTKELGNIASISFYANNFFNNMGQVYSTKTGNYNSVSNYIPSFYYGLTLRLKF
jgi:hypothetical protein